MRVLTLGTFDIPHYGHYSLLSRCSRIGLTEVGLNTDEFVTKYKGKPPILTYEERARTLSDWGYHVWPNSQPDGTIMNVIEKSKPNIIAIGTDWLRRPYLVQIGIKVEELEQMGIGLLYLPYTNTISTTEIKKRCASV